MSEVKRQFSAETIEDMLYLCHCILNKGKADLERIQKMDLPAVYRASRFHSLAALTGQALEQARTEDPFWTDNGVQAVLASFYKVYNKSVQQQVMMALEYSKLSAFLEQKKIWHLPLKGIVLKEDYPKIGLREMSDYDILFDSSYQEKVRGWFETQGYEIMSYGCGAHDVYQKLPVYNFEMHRVLHSNSEVFQQYYDDVRQRLLPDAGKQYTLHFSTEDFYVYILSHAYKHYCNMGTGLRLLTDLYVFLNKHSGNMDWDYIRQELQKLQLTEFENAAKELAFAVLCTHNEFSSERLTLDLKKLFIVLAGSGTYGTAKNMVKNRVEKQGKLSYLLERVFPARERMSAYFPACRAYPILYPAAWFYRLFVLLSQRRRSAFNELRLIIKYRSEQGE